MAATWHVSDVVQGLSERVSTLHMVAYIHIGFQASSVGPSGMLQINTRALKSPFQHCLGLLTYMLGC